MGGCVVVQSIGEYIERIACIARVQMDVGVEVGFFG